MTVLSHVYIIYINIIVFQEYAREGLRTLVIAQKHLTHEEYAEWAARYHAARLDRISESDVHFLAA